VNSSSAALAELQREQSPPLNMVWIPGGTFRMASDKHYPEEAPVHRVTVGGFWIDRTPVTNRQFKQFVRSTRRLISAAARREKVRSMMRRGSTRCTIR
jgi:formylglycine-generating enzyme